MLQAIPPHQKSGPVSAVHKEKEGSDLRIRDTPPSTLLFLVRSPPNPLVLLERPVASFRESGDADICSTTV